MNILGINAYHGDAAACLLVDGKPVAAIEEERIRRVKHWAGFPSEAIRWCLDYTGITPDQLDHVAVGRDPRAHLHKKLFFALRRRPSWAMLRDRQANRARVTDIGATLAQTLGVPRLRARMHNVEHHRAHMASSFFASPFDKAACLSVDGFGDYVSLMIGCGEGDRLSVRSWVEFPHSLGAFYTAGTQYLGFERYGDEYKVMGLAPYGEPEFLAEMAKIIRFDEKEGLRLDLEWFRHHREIVDTRWDDGAPELGPYFSESWRRRFGPSRQPGEPIESRHRNMARSLQERTEEILFAVLGKVSAEIGGDGLCLAGGCALNSVANGKLANATPFRELFVPPAAGDAGTALGAAYWVWHQVLGRSGRNELDRADLGPETRDSEVRAALDGAGLDYRWIDEEEERIERAVDALVRGDVVGWFQGRSEWGPRALGYRSILCDPRRAEMKALLNSKIKRREEFRPFAPSIPIERLSDYFEHRLPVPFMSQVVRIRPERREEIPAVCHIDGSGRVQTVSRDTNPLYHRLLTAFGRRTGTPVLLNTSFNENEPIVNTPQQAVDCFRRTRMDTLVLGSALVSRRCAD